MRGKAALSPLGSCSMLRRACHRCLLAVAAQAVPLIYPSRCVFCLRVLSARLAACTCSAAMRPLRHTTTLAAVRIVLAVTARATAFMGQAATTERQRDNEARLVAALRAEAALASSKGDKKAIAAATKALEAAAARLAQLDGTATELRRHVESAQALMDSVFESVFVHRYRDVSPLVRADALTYLGEWVAAYPSMFLENRYLKYLGWMLNDKQAPVRRRAVQAIERLYTQLPGDQLSRMDEFMIRFRGRVSEMVRDVDVDVAADALSVLRHALLADQLTMDEVAAVRAALAAEKLAVRRGAAAFLCDQLPAFGPLPEADVAAAREAADAAKEADEAAATEGSKTKGRAAAAAKVAAAKAAVVAAAAARRARAQLLSLVELGASLLPETALESASTATRASLVMEFIASAFWGHAEASVLADWQAYATLLLGDAGRASAATGVGAAASSDADEELTETSARLALRLLAAAAARASGDSQLDGAVGVPEAASVPPGGGAGGSPSSSAAAGGANFVLVTDAAAVERVRDAMSAALAPVLPELLARYGSDAHNAALLATIVLRVSLAVFGSGRQAKAFTDLTYQLSRLLQQHTSPYAVQPLAAALARLCQEEHAKQRDADTAVRKVVASLADRVASLNAAITDGDEPAAASGAAKAAKARRGRGGAGAGEAAAATSEADAVSALQAVLLRLRALGDALDLSALLPEVLSPGSQLTAALLSVLRSRQRVSTLFDAAASWPSDDPAELLAQLAPTIVRDALGVLSSAAAWAGVRAAAASVRYRDGGKSDAEEDGVRAAVGVCAAWRNVLVENAVTSLALRYPGGYASQPKSASPSSSFGQADDAGAAIAVPGLTAEVSAEEYAIPGSAQLYERAYLWRCRLAGYDALTTLAVLASPAVLAPTSNHAAGWAPAPATAALMSLFFLSIMRADARDLRAMGVALPRPDGGAAEDCLEADTQGDDDDDGTDTLAPAGIAAARARAHEALDTALQLARARYGVAPMVHAALGAPEDLRLARELGRRVLDSANEAGVAGAMQIRLYTRALKERDPEAMLGMQLRSVLAVCTDVRDTLAALAAQPARADEVLAAAEAGLNAAVALVKRHVSTIGVARAPQALLAPLARTVQVAINVALNGAPDMLLLLPLAAHYTPLLPSRATEMVREYLDQQLRRVLDTDTLAVAEAALAWWEALVTGASEAVLRTAAAGYDEDTLRLYAPLAAFRHCLVHELGASKMHSITARALREVLAGYEASIAPSGRRKTPASAGRGGRGAAVDGAAAMDLEDETGAPTTAAKAPRKTSAVSAVRHTGGKRKAAGGSVSAASSSLTGSSSMQDSQLDGDDEGSAGGDISLQRRAAQSSTDFISLTGVSQSQSQSHSHSQSHSQSNPRFLPRAESQARGGAKGSAVAAQSAGARVARASAARRYAGDEDEVEDVEDDEENEAAARGSWVGQSGTAKDEVSVLRTKPMGAGAGGAATASVLRKNGASSLTQYSQSQSQAQRSVLRASIDEEE